MPCKLGIDNSRRYIDGEYYIGGKYRGAGIAKMVGSIIRQLEADGFVGPEDRDRPNIWIEYGKGILRYFIPCEDISQRECGSSLYNCGEIAGGGPMVSEIFEDDDLYDKINCGGFGREIPGDSSTGFSVSCDNCPYLEIEKTSDKGQYLAPKV